jgi:hypothetical protein
MCEIARRIESECRLKNLTRSVGDGPRGGSEGHGLLAGAFCFLRPQDFSGFRCHPSRRAVRVPPDRRRTENQIPGQRVAGDQDRPERPSITYVRRCGSVFPGAHMLSFTGLETASMAWPPAGGSTTCRPVPRERCGTRDRRQALEEHVGASAGTASHASVDAISPVKAQAGNGVFTSAPSPAGVTQRKCQSAHAPLQPALLRIRRGERPVRAGRALPPTRRNTGVTTVT